MGKDIIKVIWEDTVENFSDEKIRKVQKYFTDKYKTDKVNVIYKSIVSNASTSVSTDNISGDLLIDTEYQHRLMKAYIKDHEYNDIKWDYLAKLDSTVNANMEEDESSAQRFKKFAIKKVEFSNFLSFSPEKHKFKLSDHHGIVTVQSMPSNFGGKTVFTVDLLLFLFFNTTTRTSKSEEIFNRYSKGDEVVVRGEVEIDNSDYIIERTVKRSKKRDGTYNVVTSLDFYQVFDGVNIIKLNGEQRAATDQIIKEYIGTKEDFLLTIVTTAKNLEDLIETKPTERGQILTRFIGIDFFQTKEKVAKQLYNDWLLKTKIRYCTKDSLLAENERITGDISGLDKQLVLGKDEIIRIDNELIEKRKEKETLLRTIVAVDQELYKIDEGRVSDDIEDLKRRITEKEQTVAEQKKNLDKPKTNFDIDEYNALKKQLAEAKKTEASLIKQISDLSSVMSDLSTFTDCSICGKVVFNDETTKKIKQNQEDTVKTQKDLEKITAEIKKLDKKIGDLDNIRDLWGIYDKALLLVEKSELDLQRLNDSKDRGEKLLSDYRKNKTLIDKNRETETTINKLQIQINNLDEEKMSQSLLTNTLEQDMVTMRNKIQENIESIAQLQKEVVFQRHYLAYIEMFGKNGIGKMVLATMIPLINSYLSQILNDVSEFRLEVELNDKNMVEFNMVNDKENVVTPLQAGSGFERTVASIALRCALSKICSLPKPNIIVFDEVFGKVSNENLERMSNLFDRLKEFFDIIIIISHNPIVHEWGDAKIIVVKENNMSRLTIENV